MSSLLEILGRAITIDTSELIRHWLKTVRLPDDSSESAQYRQLSKIIELMSDMKFGTAAEQLRLYLFENPSCVRGRLGAAAICLRDNRLNEAIDELNSVYMHQPNNTMALYALGHCYERLGKESQAVEFYQDCLKFKNYLQLPAQRLAAVYFKNGQLEKTIQQYELLKSEYPDDISTLVTLGQLYIAAAKYFDAAETFNTAILMHPDNFHTDEPEIDELVRDGQLHEALEQLDDLSTTEPHRADLLMRRADILAGLGATTDALAQYEDAVRLCPDFLEATIKLGTLYLQLDQDYQAAQQFNKAVEINDSIVDAYIGLATAHKLAGNTTDALATLSLAGAIQPNSSLLFAETATLHFKAGLRENPPYARADEQTNLTHHVIEAHRTQIASRPQNPDLHYRLGVLLLAAGRFDDAIPAFEAAVDINPLYSRARTKLAVCLFETNRAKRALEQLTPQDCLAPETLNLHYRTALLYCNKLKFASTLLNLERLMESNFAYPAAADNISIVLQNLGLLDRVSTTWENLAQMVNQALDTDPPPAATI